MGSGCDTCPRCELTGGREDRHVATGLGDEDFRGAATPARDRAQHVDHRFEAGESIDDARGQLLDRRVKEGDVVQDLASDDPMMDSEVPVRRERQLVFLALLPDPWVSSEWVK